MSRNISVGLKIGAALDGTFSSVFAGANTTINNIGKTTELLTRRQQRLGQTMARALSHPARSVGSLRTHYDRLGLSIDRLKNKQIQYNIALAKQSQLAEQRKNLGMQAVGVATGAYANARFLKESVGRSASFQDSVQDIGIRGRLNSIDETKVGSIIRQAAGQTNQDVSVLAASVSTLVQDGASISEIETYTVQLGQVTSGLRISAEESTAAFLSLRDMGVKDGEQMQKVLDQLIWSGQQGGLGADGMMKSIGQLNDEIKKHGLGLDSLGDIAATLQVGDATMGTDNAMQGLKGWLDEMNTNRRTEAYKSAGVDYSASMQQAIKDGYSEFEASMKIADQFLDNRLGKSGITELQNSQGDSNKLQAVIEKFGLSEVFRDQNQIQMIMGYRQNKNKFNAIREGGQSEGQSNHALDNVFSQRMRSPMEKFKAMGGSLKELSMSIGDVLLPPIITLVDKLTPVIDSIAKWVTANPKLVTGIVAVTTAIVALKVATLAAAWGTNFFVKSLLIMLDAALNKAGINIELFRAKMLLGNAATGRFGLSIPKVGAAITSVGKAFATVGRAMLLNPIGLAITGIAVAALLIYKYWQPIKAFFSGVFEGMTEALSPVTELFSEVFGELGTLFKPVISVFSSVWEWCSKLFEPFQASEEQLAGATSAGRTFGKVLGTALNIILTPVKLLLTAIGWVGKAIRMVFNWSPMETIKTVWSGVTDWFDGVWTTISDSFSGGISDIGKLIIDWSPLGLFTKAFSGVLSWFGIDLPDSLSEAGSALIDGLVGGITKKWDNIKETVTNLGSSVTGWFKDKLGINSPSRIFIGFGENISQGAALGIEKETGSVNKAALGLAAATAITFATPALASQDINLLSRPPQDPIYAPDPAAMTRINSTASDSSGMVIHFSPNITVNGGGDIATQLNYTLKMSYEDFFRLMKLYEHRTKRGAYQGIKS